MHLRTTVLKALAHLQMLSESSEAVGHILKHTCTCVYIYTRTFLLLLLPQDVMLEKFAQRQPSCVAYDEKMHFYSQVVAEVDSQSALKEVEFARLDMEPLAASLRENARQWVAALGKRLNEATRTKLTQLKTELEVHVYICVCMCTCKYTCTCTHMYV